MRGFSFFGGRCAATPPELYDLYTLHKKSLRNLYNLPLIIFPKTLDTPNEICYTMYVVKGRRQSMRTLNDRTDPKKFLENYRNPLTNYILYAIMYIVNEREEINYVYH